MLEVAGVSKHFDGVFAVNNVTFSIPAGSITGLIGPNGAGKTTLFNLITGFLEPESGAMSFHGKALNGSKPHQIAAGGIGRTFQNLRIIRGLSVMENVLLASNDGGVSRSIMNAFRGSRVKGSRQRAIELLDFVGIKDKRNDPASALSYGQQKLLSLACCLALDPTLLLLDEPVAGVNQEMITKILGLLESLKKEREIGIFMIEHNLGAVMEISDRLIVMDGGSIIADGNPEVVRQNPAVIEAYLE